MKSTQNLPLRLKELRNKHNYSQEQLAEILNVSRQAVSRWENGKAVPDIDNMLFLSELYDVPLDYMLGEELDDNSETKCLESTKEVIPIVEILVIFILLILSLNISIICIPFATCVFIWIAYTKRHYKSVYILCVVCIIAGIYDMYILYTHFNGICGSPFSFFIKN